MSSGTSPPTPRLRRDEKTHASGRRAVTPKTKMIVVNTPHNPVGKVFTRAELEGIAKIAEQHNLIVMSVEVVRLPLLISEKLGFPDVLPV